jgi:hypothetical protein
VLLKRIFQFNNDAISRKKKKKFYSGGGGGKKFSFSRLAGDNRDG